MIHGVGISALLVPCIVGKDFCSEWQFCDGNYEACYSSVNTPSKINLCSIDGLAYVSKNTAMGTVTT